MFSSSVTPLPNTGGCPRVSRLLPVFARKALSPELQAGRQAAPQPFLLLQPGLGLCLATCGALLPSAGHQLPRGLFKAFPGQGIMEREKEVFFFLLLLLISLRLFFKLKYGWFAKSSWFQICCCCCC